MEVNLGDRVWLLGHNREGVVVGVGGHGSNVAVASLDREGERVTEDVSRDELSPFTVNIMRPRLLNRG